MSQAPERVQSERRSSKNSNQKERHSSKDIDVAPQETPSTRLPAKTGASSAHKWAHPSQRNLSILDEPSTRSKIQRDLKKGESSTRLDESNRVDSTKIAASAPSQSLQQKTLDVAPEKDAGLTGTSATGHHLPLRSQSVSIAQPKEERGRVKKDRSVSPSSKGMAYRNKTHRKTRTSMSDKGGDNQSKNSDFALSGDMAGVHPDFLDESYLQPTEGEPRNDSRSDKSNFKGRRFTEHKKMKIADIKRHYYERNRRGFRVGAPDWELTKRLPDDAVPFHYAVYLEPHIESDLFYGKVTIAIDLVLPKSQIWLHARNLQITSTQLFDSSDEQIPILGAHKFRKHEFLVIFLEGNLRPGLYALSIDFNGALSPLTSVGMFSRSYKLRDGTTRHIVCTQMEPLYARRVFPCFDEPSFKASYDISIVRPTTDFVVISNAIPEKEEEETPQKGLTTVYFENIPSMSPFNFVLVICPLFRTPVTVPGFASVVNVFTKEEKMEDCSKAIDVLVEALNWFSCYFEVEYPFPKFDLVIAPELSALAVEGSSIAVIQEELLQVQEEYEYETLHYTVARVVASQWIGCSVTISWWSDLWYKEGLTMMLANLFLDLKFPEQQALMCVYVASLANPRSRLEAFSRYDSTLGSSFSVKPLQIIIVDGRGKIPSKSWGIAPKMMERLYKEIPNFLCYLMQPCLFGDTLDNTKRIDRIIHDPNDVAEYMDPIAFTKAAAVFRMLEQTDPSSFKDGLTIFLNKFQMQSASWKSLSRCLQDANEKSDMYTMNLENVFASWSQYPGYPLVVSARGQRAVAMTHRRFLSSLDAKTHDMSHFPTWEFPITYTISKEPDVVRVLCMKADSIDSEVRVAIPGGVCWYKVNMRQTGFYRVVYQEDEWNNIKQILQNKPQLLTVEDRANILDDMFSLSRAGYLCYGQTLITLTYLRSGLETSWLPWACVLKHLIFIKNSMAKDENDLKNFQNYVSYIVDPILNEDVWNISKKDDTLRRKWKLAVLRFACSMEIPSVKAQSAKILNSSSADVKKIKPLSLRCLVLKHGSPSNGYTANQWLALWRLYTDEINQLYKYKILGIMSSSGNEMQMTNLLQTIKTNQDINDHGFFTVLYEMATTRPGCHLVWKFIQGNWTYLRERFGPMDSRLVLLFPHVAQLVDEQGLVDEMMVFNAHDVPSLQTALNFAKNNVHWNCRYRKTVSSWLNNIQKVLKRVNVEKFDSVKGNSAKTDEAADDQQFEEIAK